MDDALPRWRLEELYSSADDPAIAADFARLEERARGFAERYENRLSECGSGGLGAALAEYEAIQQIGHRLSLYAELRASQDETDAAAQKFLGDTQSRLTECLRPVVFFTLELNRIDEAALSAWIAESAALARYRHWLDKQRAMRPHQLEDRLERFIHDTEPAGDAAWRRLYSTTRTEMSFRVGDEDLSLERTLDVLKDPDRDRRQAAYSAMTEEFNRNIKLFTHISNTLMQSKLIEDRWRSLPTPQASRHLDNAIEPEIVQALRDAVVDAYPAISHAYYAMKARWMGLDRLEGWDRAAPLPGSADRRYSWAAAQDIVVGAMTGFAPEIGDITRQFFDRGWIDAAVTPGKTPGAFSASGPADVHPFVLLNYQGRTRDVMTLAHELGHGVHQILAAEQGELLAHTPLTLAETASVFGEMLTFRRMLDAEGDPAARRVLLAGKAEDMINTVVRQISFHEFESRAHAARAEGELTVEDFGRIWMEISKESLGAAVHLDERYQNFWCYVSHFVWSPFYVYAYAFGDGLVNALYGLYCEQPDGFAERYMELLRAGGSLSHQELLKPFGLDLRDPEFWKIGLDMIAEIIREAGDAAADPQTAPAVA